jgi:ribonuclease HI
LFEAGDWVQKRGLYVLQHELWEVSTNISQVKSFTTREDANAYLNGQDPSQNPSSPSYQPKFYAVKNGRVPGIYTDWSRAQEQVKGWTKPQLRAFSSKPEAEAFMNGETVPLKDSQAKAIVASTKSLSRVQEGQRNIPKFPNVVGGFNDTTNTSTDPIPLKKRRKEKAIDIVEDMAKKTRSTIASGVHIKAVGQTQSGEAGTDPPILNIYTDGSSLGNGKLGATAGFGVWFGNGDQRQACIDVNITLLF